MLEMPKRSVTRFFVPMIDVLTLLFCIYLLMPMVRSAEDIESEEERLRREQKLKDVERELLRKMATGADIPENLQKEIEKLRKEKAELLKNRVALRVLEINDKTGKLFFRDSEGKLIEIRTRDEARELIEQDRRKHGATNKELYYLILYPRDLKSGYPTRAQRLAYDQWFEGVALSYDIP